jgi:hypothetical protein
MLYADHPVKESVATRKQGASYNHPCSPAAKKSSQAIESLSKLTVKRPQSPGFFDTSMKY